MLCNIHVSGHGVMNVSVFKPMLYNIHVSGHGVMNDSIFEPMLCNIHVSGHGDSVFKTHALQYTCIWSCCDE